MKIAIIDTDYSFDTARDRFKDQWGKNLEELTHNTSQSDIHLIKKELKSIGFAYKAHTYLSTLKTTDLSEQQKNSLHIVTTTLEELTQKVPPALYSQLWLDTSQSINWQLNDTQKLLFTEMITAHHNNTKKVIQELNRLTSL